MIVVDADIWLSALIAGEVHHEHSQAWLRRQDADGILLIVPSLTLAEVAGAIARRSDSPVLGRQAVERVVETLRPHMVPINSDLGHLAARFAAMLRLRGADALYVAVAHSLSAPSSRVFPPWAATASPPTTSWS